MFIVHIQTGFNGMRLFHVQNKVTGKVHSTTLIYLSALETASKLNQLRIV